MTIAQLIDYLSQFDPDTKVVLDEHDIDEQEPFVSLSNPDLEY